MTDEEKLDCLTWDDADWKAYNATTVTLPLWEYECLVNALSMVAEQKIYDLPVWATWKATSAMHKARLTKIILEMLDHD